MRSKANKDNSKGDFERQAEAAYPSLYRAAVVLCRSRSDVEDAVQETMMRAFKSYSSFRGEASFTSWAYRILARVVEAANRKNSRPMPDEWKWNGAPHYPSADRDVIVDEEARRLVQAIRSLPKRQKEMITLHYLDDASYKEIAAALDVSVGTVKGTLFEAKTNLRKMISLQEINRKTNHVVP